MLRLSYIPEYKKPRARVTVYRKSGIIYKKETIKLIPNELKLRIQLKLNTALLSTVCVSQA